MKVKYNVIPSVGLETGAGNASVQPFMICRVPYIPNTGSVVALRPEHEFCPGGELGYLLVELKNIEFQRLRILGIAGYVEPKVHFEVVITITRPDPTDRRHLERGRLAASHASMASHFGPLFSF